MRETKITAMWVFVSAEQSSSVHVWPDVDMTCVGPLDNFSSAMSRHDVVFFCVGGIFVIFPVICGVSGFSYDFFWVYSPVYFIVLLGSVRSLISCHIGHISS